MSSRFIFFSEIANRRLLLVKTLVNPFEHSKRDLSSPDLRS